MPIAPVRVRRGRGQVEQDFPSKAASHIPESRAGKPVSAIQAGEEVFQSLRGFGAHLHAHADDSDVHLLLRTVFLRPVFSGNRGWPAGRTARSDGTMILSASLRHGRDSCRAGRRGVDHQPVVGAVMFESSVCIVGR